MNNRIWIDLKINLIDLKINLIDLKKNLIDLKNKKYLPPNKRNNENESNIIINNKKFSRTSF